MVNGHLPRRPSWACRGCAEPWPCPTYRRLLRPAQQPLAVVVLITQAVDAIRDLAEPPERVLRRFLWFTPLTEADCLAVLRDTGHA
ncbi:hypothetical protein [Micromonospora coxensis]|uniref:hypothetical protein n=1 Tax=Micromonospora coxensis TaxID=356852 RepID=UPI0034452709